MRTTFQEVSLTRQKKVYCPHCNKKLLRTKKFWQTLSPYNRDRFGLEKTREEVYKDLDIEASIWVKEAEKCSQCIRSEQKENKTSVELV